MDTLTRPAERALLSREADRLAALAMGRLDGRTKTAHYLIVERTGPIAAGVDRREIEQYRDLERVVSNAADFETGDRHGRCLGAFTLTYRDGRLVGSAVVGNLPQLVAAERAKKPDERLAKIKGASLLRSGL